MFEPEKFFIGLIDFFSILLPGAMVAYLLKLAAPQLQIGLVTRLATTGGNEGVAIFLVVSYLLGHFIFLLGAWWLDEAYDVARNRTLNHQIHELAWRGTLPPKWQRGLVWLAFKRESNKAVKRATAIKRAYLKPLAAAGALNTFQWAKVHLDSDPAALSTVHRFEADSKFFRSLSVVLFGIFVAGIFVRPGLGVLALILMPLALWRYADQRLKSTNQAYWSVIALEARKQPPIQCPRSDAVPPGTPARAGGAVYRARGGSVEYLLVEAKEKPFELVLPKGHVEEGEHPRETAVREVREEAGVWASIEQYVGVAEYDVDGERVAVSFFLMRALDGEREHRPMERGRRHHWHPLEAAIEHVTHDTAKSILRDAETLRQGAARRPAAAT